MSHLLDRFDEFVGHFHQVSPTPDDFEFAKLDALRDDLVWLKRRGHASPLSWLGRLNRAFERSVPADAPQPEAAILPASAAQPDAIPDELALGEDQEALDRLSVWYGGQYRGAILINYVFGALSGALVVWSKVLHEPWERSAGVVELLFIGAVLLVFLVGHTPRLAFEGGLRVQTLSRRWHQRWLEYRLLAERLRYASLLQPFDQAANSIWSDIIRGTGRTLGWYDYYFLWRWNQRPELGLAPARRAAWCARVRDTMTEQIAYHRAAGSRRRRLVRLLERWAMRCFILAAVFIIVHVVLLLSGVDFMSHESSPYHDHAVFMSALAAMLTLVGAAMHGILGSTELALIADNSLELVEQIEQLRVRLAPHFEGCSIEAMEPDVREFCRLVTEEATGWRALLRDKDLSPIHA